MRDWYHIKSQLAELATRVLKREEQVDTNLWLRVGRPTQEPEPVPDYSISGVEITGQLLALTPMTVDEPGPMLSQASGISLQDVFNTTVGHFQDEGHSGAMPQFDFGLEHLNNL